MNCSFLPAYLALAWAALSLSAASISLPDYQPQGPYIDTIRFLRLTLKDPRFWNRGNVHKINVRPEAPRSRLHYKVWMQKVPAPLVIILPGLGGNYANLAPSVLAEAVYRQGMSALLISSAFNWEFLLNASSSGVPGFTPADAQDIYHALHLIIHDVTNRYRRAQPTQLMLLGFSLGALDALYLAEIDQREQRLNFTRILSVNPPVNLVYAFHQLDQFYSIWTNWTPKELQQRKNKAVAIYNALFDKYAPKMTNGFDLPIDDDEAKFAIAYVFRRTLSETIKSIHSRTNFGILSTPFKASKTRFLDKEIERFGYYEYVMTFVRKAYPDQWQTLQDLNEKASLWRLQPLLASDQRILVLHTRNDFLLTDYDRDWLASLLGNRILFFNEGGHLGNLYRQEVLDLISSWLAGAPIPALHTSTATAPPVPATPIVRAEPVTAGFPRAEAVVPEPAAETNLPPPALPTPPTPTSPAPPASLGLIPVTGIVPLNATSAPPAATPLATTNIPSVSPTSPQPAHPTKPAAPSTQTPSPPPTPVKESPKPSPVRYYEEQSDRAIGGPRDDMVIEYYEEED
ncbi:MAG: hypothetical protein N2595_00130 [bacterium]|nr:hypothetical protein [bacterium]